MIDNLAFLLSNLAIVISIYFMLRAERKDKPHNSKHNRRA